MLRSYPLLFLSSIVAGNVAVLYHVVLCNKPYHTLTTVLLERNISA